MTIDVDFSKNNEIITNAEGDNYLITKNNFGTEIFLTKPLNIINIIDDLRKYYVDKLVLEFTNENEEEILKVLEQLKTRRGEYREYNYKRGVY